MLSKIDWYENKKDFEKEDKILLFQNLYKNYNNGTVIIDKKLNSGTLGLVYSAYINNKKYIIKTHQNGFKYKKRIEKEFIILKNLYNKYLDCNLYGNDFFGKFLIIEFLYKVNEEITFEKIVNSYNKLNLLKFNKQKIISEWSFYDIQKNFFLALKILHDNYFIDDKQYNNILKRQNIVNKLSDEERFLCHGDLSNKNIFCKNHEVIFLDWEDAFYGVREYDLCYWFTFFENRKILFKFREIYSGAEFERSLTICLIVIVLKSYLSILNGSYKNNSLSIKDRVQEYLEL